MISLNKNTLIKYAHAYDDKYRTKYAESTENELKKWFRGHKFLDKSRFLMLGMWKSTRQRKNYENNSEELIREVTTASLKAKNEEIQIKFLTVLSGVNFPVASVILHFAFPNKYPILDFRVIWSIGLKQPQNYTFDFWKTYCSKIQSLSKKFNLSVREIDKALWAYSKENQKIT